MKRRALSALVVIVLVFISLSTANAAERKKPNWLSSCPEVLDSTPQLATPKTIFLKSPSGQIFKLLARDSVEFVTTPQSIIGCYVFEENITNANTNPPWQIGVVNRDNQGYYFKNQAGIVWRLTLNMQTLILETAPGSAYYTQGGGFVLDAATPTPTSPTARATTPAATINPGSTCTKLNRTNVSGGLKYTCIKSGTKLVWSKGVKVATATVTPTASPKPIASATPSATNLSVVREAAIANNTFYIDRGNCHSRGINAELQAYEAGNWKRLVGAMGWEDFINCPAAQPVQPWVAVEVPAGTTLRWRFWLNGSFDLNSATFTALVKKGQTTTAAPTPTVKPSVTPTPTSNAAADAAAKAAADAAAKAAADAAAKAAADAAAKAAADAAAKAAADAAAKAAADAAAKAAADAAAKAAADAAAKAAADAAAKAAADAAAKAAADAAAKAAADAAKTVKYFTLTGTQVSCFDQNRASSFYSGEVTLPSGGFWSKPSTAATNGTIARVYSGTFVYDIFGGRGINGTETIWTRPNFFSSWTLYASGRWTPLVRVTCSYLG